MCLLNSVLNVKAVVAAFNQETVQVGTFSVIVQLLRLIVCSITDNQCISLYVRKSRWLLKSKIGTINLAGEKIRFLSIIFCCVKMVRGLLCFVLYCCVSA